MRAYTPTSSDDELGHFDLVIKVYWANKHPRFPAGGKMSQHLEALPIGGEMEVKGPLGHFHYLGKARCAAPMCSLKPHTGPCRVTNVWACKGPAWTSLDEACFVTVWPHDVPQHTLMRDAHWWRGRQGRRCPSAAFATWARPGANMVLPCHSWAQQSYCFLWAAWFQCSLVIA